jgi:hypothetical protein
MKFVELIRERINQNGECALSTEETFDQEKVLYQVQDYILSTLQLEMLRIVDTSDSEKTPADIAKSCSPGEPMIIYDFE